LALASATLLVACGGSSHGASGNGVAPKSAGAILSAAYSAVAQSKSARISGVFSSGKQRIMLNLDVAPGRGGKGSMSINGRSFELITLESRTYFNGSAAFWKRYGGGAAATLFENRWLETPTNGQFKSFAQLTNIRKIFRFLVHPGRDNLTKMGLSTVNGQKAIGVQNGTGGTLYVATVGKPYPIEIEKPGSEGGHVTFSDFNQPVSIHPPAGAINMSQLNSK
jgi:hypothetical protein